MNERRRTMLFSGGYKIPTENGVYIESVEHKFYLTDDWDSTNTANSIAVVTNAHSFRIALYCSSSTMLMNNDPYAPWGTYLSGTTNSGITSSSVAVKDFNGATNTHLIVTKCQSSTGYATGWCAAYTFPDGETKGYLPAEGELYLAYQNNAAVDAALAKCGGTAMARSNNHWSSTFFGGYGIPSGCWMLNWYDGYVSYGNLGAGYYVRAFGALEDSN